jgi:hypothetical protein
VEGKGRRRIRGGREERSIREKMKKEEEDEQNFL